MSQATEPREARFEEPRDPGSTAARASRWTIHHVAKLADVSVGTVSRVLNGHANVTPETKVRVQEAIDRLGYVPSAAARTLRRQQSRTIGLVVPHFHSPFFGELIDAIEAEAANVGFDLIVVASRGSMQGEQTRFRELEARQVEGLLFVASSTSTEVPSHLTFPVIALDRFMPDLDWIGSNNRGGTKTAVDFLLSLGHGVIAFISGPQELAPARSRLTAFREAMATTFEQHRLVADHYVHVGAFDYRGGMAGASLLLTRQPRPTAVICSNDEQAVGVFRAAADLGIAIPRDLSVIGFDNIALADMLNPRLTTVGQPIGSLAKRAVMRIIERLASEGAPAPAREMLSTTLQLRESCAAPRRPDAPDVPPG